MLSRASEAKIIDLILAILQWLATMLAFVSSAEPDLSIITDDRYKVLSAGATFMQAFFSACGSSTACPAYHNSA